jgi:hypothetical protein
MTSEVAILREHYPTNMPISELAKLLPNHPPGSFKAYAQKVLKIYRPSDGRFYKDHGWEKIVELLKKGPRTAREIADLRGVSLQSTCECLRNHRAEWHVCGEIPRQGNYPRLIALGPGEDVSIARVGRTKKWRRPPKLNPFLVAQGMVAPKETIKGRVIKQDMTIHLHDELEEA